jgi:hypothetical protein
MVKKLVITGKLKPKQQLFITREEPGFFFREFFKRVICDKSQTVFFTNQNEQYDDMGVKFSVFRMVWHNQKNN